MAEIDTTTETPLPEKRPEMIAALTLHAGPLPPPETVERYEFVLPGSFDRILTMAEREQQNKFEQNRSGWVFAHCGQIFGFVTIVIYFAILALTVWFENTTMFTALFAAGAFAGLSRLIRSYQRKNGGES
jgi:uncharacterized membrane protein